MVNMAISVSLGLFAGFVSAFWYSVVHPKLNKTSVFDSHGLLGAFLIVSIFGSLVFAPALLGVYSNLGLISGTFVDANFTIGDTAAGFQLVYAAIAAGVGIFFGILSGIFGIIIRSSDDDFNDAGLFVQGDYGLYNPKKHHEKEVVQQDSAGNLHPHNP